MAELTFSPVVAASGVALQTIRVGNGISTWTITQISVELASPSAPTGSTCEVRKNDYLVSLAIPTGDAVAGDPPLTLLPSDVLTVKWSGCTPGAVAKILMFYTEGL